MSQVASSTQPTPVDERDAEAVVAALGMELLEGEGVWISPVYRSAHGSAIHALLTTSGFSAMHRLVEDELWVHVAGAPVQMLVLHAEGAIDEPILGSSFGADERSAVLVPAGSWQGASPLGSWSLVVCALAPPFSGLELADATTDFTRWAPVADRIRSLMRG